MADKWNMRRLPDEGCRQESGVQVTPNVVSALEGSCNGCYSKPDTVWKLQVGNMVVRLCDECMTTMKAQIMVYDGMKGNDAG